MSSAAVAGANATPAAQTKAERIAILEERSQHAATKADLERQTRLMVMWFISTQIALTGLLAGLMIHLFRSAAIS